MNIERVKAIADAVLYEGYILYPYRASAVKNQQRFNFGLLAPGTAAEEARTREETPPTAAPSNYSPRAETEMSMMRTECLVEDEDPVVEIRVRFLQLVSRQIYRVGNSRGDAGETAIRYEPVRSLKVGDDVHQTWQEAVQRDVDVPSLRLAELIERPTECRFAFDAEQTCEALSDGDHFPAGKVVRTQEAITGRVTLRAESQRPRLTKLSVVVANTTGNASAVPGSDSSITEQSGDQATHDSVPLRSLASTHTILGVRGGRFVSLFDPPDKLKEFAGDCRNVGTWPVLVGDESQADMMLSSPIILYDYPQIAPESGGDFFDGTEIDEMLALRVATLTDDEKREMRHVDQRARQILQRTEAMSADQWRNLHGTIRGLKAT